MRRIAFTALLMTAAVSGEALTLPFLSPRVTIEYDHAAPLSRRTYSWGGVRLAVPKYGTAIQGAADKYLQARGWQLLPSGGSATVFATGDVQGIEELDQGYGQDNWGVGQWGPQGLGGGWNPTYGEATVNALATAESHLVLDIFDTNSHRLLFRGVTGEDLSGTEKKNVKGLTGRVKQMFKKFPPK